MALQEDTQLTLPDGSVVGIAEYGVPDGLPVFFFHGWPSSRRQGRLLDKPARNLGLRILAPDRPGIGLSSFQPDRKLLDWPPVQEQLADALELDTFSVLGVSGGGPYALACASALPERLAATGIICGAPPFEAFTDLGGLHASYRFLRMVRRVAPWSMSPFLPLARKVSRLRPDHLVVRGFMRTIPEVDRAALADREVYEAVTLSFQDAARNGMRPLIVDGDVYFSEWGFDVEEIRPRVRIWHGERDTNIPARMAKEIASRMPNAVAKWYPGDGHYSLPTQRLNEMLKEFAEDAFG